VRRVVLALLGLLVLAGAGAAAVWVWNERQSEDVRGSATQEFVTTEEPGATTRPEEEVREEPWPTYGFDAQRTRYAPDFRLRPPFRVLWTVRGKSLIEFPPAVAYERLYFGTNNGRFLAVDVDSGEIVWERQFGRCTAASPMVADGVVYMGLMVPTPCGKDSDRDAPGYLLALDADTGQELWRFRAGAIESSPLLVDGVLYVGSWDENVYAVDARTGRARWSFQTGDEVKGAAAYGKGTVFIASYDGNVYALDARSGKLRWEAAAQDRLGGQGNWYATPAVAYGRVFIGNTDGKVYAFGARSGELLWAQSTGSYIYSSAAVWDRKVFVGSHDGRLYALDAATGDQVWSFDAGAAISGSPTVLAGIVYASTVRGPERTYGVDARSGRRVWTFPDGKYTPVVADEERVYLTGYTRIYGLEPKR
jgi:outer membrane protein assembly factor BamB